MADTRPESNTAPPQRHRINIHAVYDALTWVRTGVTVYSLLAGSNTASSATKTITELAVQALAAILGLDN
ncbi:hypothetical protein [Nocardia sp. NPDC051463]|uniref:hypothetical protein n=1 Tax=Nocardia sp. NPDC051463 TaxID=3154845 RepID=UPI00345012DD